MRFPRIPLTLVVGVVNEHSGDFKVVGPKTKDQILGLLKDMTYCDILQLLTDVELEIKI